MGLVGGIVGAALLVAVLVLVFNFGEARSQETVVQTAPTVYAPSGSATATGQGLTPAQIYQGLSGGVVMIQSDFGSSTNGLGQTQSGQALGTGFVVDSQGHVLTNAHVVQSDTTGQRAQSVTVVFNKGGSKTQSVPGQIIGIDSGSDVAVIKVNPSGVTLRPLPLGNSDRVLVGEPVVAIGNPLGYDFSITSGIVSAVGRTLDAPNGMRISNGIQTDAAINPGNSGGPLIDSTGRVIGINEQIATSSGSATGGNQGLGFAVPINTAVKSMSQLEQSGHVTYAWMGIAGQTLTPQLATMFKIPAPQGGALIEQVTPNGPAQKAGLKGGTQTTTVQGQAFTIGGDVITAVDGKTVQTFDDLIAILAAHKPGDKVTVTYERGGQSHQTIVTLAERPANLK